MLKVRTPDKTPLNWSSEEKSKISKKLGEIYHVLSFFNEVAIKTDGEVGDVEAALCCAEGYFKELSELTGYDGLLKKEMEERHAEIRAKNFEIRELKDQLGKTDITGEVFGNIIRRMEDGIRRWGKRESFHFSTDYNFGPHAISFTLCCGELDKPDDNPHVHTPEMKIAEGWDIAKDRYHDELLDTPNNRARLEAILTRDFKNARVFKYESWKSDNGYWLIRHAEVYLYDYNAVLRVCDELEQQNIETV